MIKLIRKLLLQIISDIDNESCYLNEEQQKEILDIILRYSIKEFSKIEAANYLGISRATFDNYIKEGKLPKGLKRSGFKELSWSKIDLDKFKNGDKLV